MFRSTLLAALTLCSLAAPTFAGAVSVHVVDGVFGSNEWNGSLVKTASFPAVGAAGGATLYIDQEFAGSPTINFALDYNNPSAGAVGFFDIFLRQGATDYAAKISTAGVVAEYSKSAAALSTLNPDGSLNFTDPVWSSATFTLDGKFSLDTHTAAGGATTSRPFLEFSLTRAFAASASFLSIAAGASPADPPISSAIFQLNPDGTTTIDPLFAPTGAPALQPQDVAPTPLPAALPATTALLLALACFKMLSPRKNSA